MISTLIYLVNKYGSLCLRFVGVWGQVSYLHNSPQRAFALGVWLHLVCLGHCLAILPLHSFHTGIDVNPRNPSYLSVLGFPSQTGICFRFAQRPFPLQTTLTI